MPRGGGSRGGGGGFRGGGFSGGGSRGGGFRGGGISVRPSYSRSSGRPFGRTGARRTVIRSPSGPYSHRRYSPRRRYYRYGYGYWPWYRRWWYRPWWAGYWYRPWYYSPVYIGGGVLLALFMLLIILPIFGVAIWYPFSNADANGQVNYRSTETLYFNEYWYEYEYIEKGNTITFSVQSNPSKISFAIYNLPFDYLPTTNKQGGDALNNLQVLPNGYKYYSIFLNPQSTITYNYNASSAVDFFILDADNFYIWDYSEYYNYYTRKLDSTSGTGQVTVDNAQDYYVIWYNDGASALTVEYIINYTALDVVDFTQANYYQEAVDTVSQNTFTVPSAGNWYFFVYFDPMYSPEYSTDITFDVTYDTGVTADERWLQVQPFLFILVVVILIILVIAVIARRSQKKRDAKIKATKATKNTIEKQEPKEELSKCERCGAPLRKGANFCAKCGGKVQGRQTITPQVTTKPSSKTCAYCGSKLTADDNFCRYCGAKIEKQFI